MTLVVRAKPSSNSAGEEWWFEVDVCEYCSALVSHFNKDKHAT